jgi:hypothetical protein
VSGACATPQGRLLHSAKRQITVIHRYSIRAGEYSLSSCQMRECSSVSHSEHSVIGLHLYSGKAADSRDPPLTTPSNARSRDTKCVVYTACQRFPHLRSESQRLPFQILTVCGQLSLFLGVLEDPSRQFSAHRHNLWMDGDGCD